jgi:hypothetical protein
MSGFRNDVCYAKNIDLTAADNQTVTESHGLFTDGQMWIGTTTLNVGGTHINVGKISSPNSTVIVDYSSPDITLDVNMGVISYVSPLIDFKTIGLTPLFTISATKRFAPFAYSTIIQTNVSMVGDAQYSLGWTAPNYSDYLFLASFFPGMAGDVNNIFNTSAVMIFPANTTIYCNVSAPDSGTTVTGYVNILGYYV